MSNVPEPRVRSRADVNGDEDLVRLADEGASMFVTMRPRGNRT
jgi:hypothetical protein